MEELTQEEVQAIQDAFALTDWDRGPIEQDERNLYDTIMRKLGRDGYESPWAKVKL